MITLRNYQTEARYQINTLLNAGRHPLFVSGTGSGKTLTSVYIIEDQINIGNTVYVTTPQIEIFDQWLKELVNAGQNPGTINDKGISITPRKVYVCMIQSLNNYLPYIPEAIYPDIIIDDEAHLSAANSYRAVHAFFPNSKRYGMTGSPYRYDNKPLGDIYTDMVQTIEMKECMDKGYLAESIVIVPEKHYTNIEIPESGNEHNMEEQAVLLGKTQIIGNFIEDYGHIYQGKPVMVACCTIEHAKLVCEQFNDAGWNFKQLASDLPKHERKKIIDQIRANKINGVTTVGVGVLGLDIPGLYGVMWLTRTMSLTKWLQLCGRGLRAMFGKKYGIIYDPVGNVFLHGRPEMIREWGLDGDYTPIIKDPDMPIQKICPFCGVANASDNIICHFCGEDMTTDEARKLKMRKLPTIVDGELVIVKSDGQIEEIKRRIVTAKEAVQEYIEEQKEKQIKQEAIIVTMDDKKKVLRDGMFLGRKMFKEAVRNYL